MHSNIFEFFDYDEENIDNLKFVKQADSQNVIMTVKTRTGTPFQKPTPIKPILRPSKNFHCYKQLRLDQKKGYQHDKSSQKLSFYVYFIKTLMVIKKKVTIHKILRANPSRKRAIKCSIQQSESHYYQEEYNYVNQAYECLEIIMLISKRFHQSQYFNLILNAEMDFSYYPLEMIKALSNIIQTEQLLVDIKRCQFNKQDTNYVFNKIIGKNRGVINIWRISLQAAEAIQSLSDKEIQQLFMQQRRQPYLSNFYFDVGSKNSRRVYLQHKLDKVLPNELLSKITVSHFTYSLDYGDYDDNQYYYDYYYDYCYYGTDYVQNWCPKDRTYKWYYIG